MDQHIEETRHTHAHEEEDKKKMIIKTTNSKHDIIDHRPRRFYQFTFFFFTLQELTKYNKIYKGARNVQKRHSNISCR